MSVAAALNPINPTEVLAFIYSHPDSDSEVTNLAVKRLGLAGTKDPPFRDFNYASALPLSNPAGLDIAYYNGAPRVFGFVDYVDPNSGEGDGEGSQNNDIDPERVLTQLSPTVTPIHGLEASGSEVKQRFTGTIATVSTANGETAYLYALRGTNKDAPADLVFYTLSSGDPYASIVQIGADYGSQLAAALMRDSGEPRHFFQARDELSLVQWGEVETKRSGTVPRSKVKIANNSPISLVHEFQDPNEEHDAPPNLFLYYVDKDTNRIYRAKYDYSIGTGPGGAAANDEEEEARWETGVERIREPLRDAWRWIRAVPWKAGSVDLFYYNQQGQLTQVTDDLTAGANQPAKKIPKEE